MKNEKARSIINKIKEGCLWVFGIGVTVCVLAGALSLLGFIVAICIGGETATDISVFIHKSYFPWIIRFTTIFAAFGLLGMYLSKTKALTLSSGDNSNEEKANDLEENIVETNN